MSVITQSVRLPLPADVRDQWRALERGSEQPSVFRAPEWIEAWAEATGMADETTVHLWSDNGELVGVLPLTPSRERLHPRVPVAVSVTINAGAGAGAGDHTGWSATATGGEHVAAWLAASRRTVLLRNLDTRLVGDLDGVAGIPIQREMCPRLDLTQGRRRSASFDKRLAYYRRRAVREGCELTVTMPGHVTHDQLVALSSLHDQRFGTSSVLSPRAIAIQEAFRRRQRADVGPVVVTASIDGRPIGMLWGLWFAGVFAYYQSGWDQEHRALNLGTVLVDHAISTAVEMGADTFDFLRGAEDYKYKFGAVDREDASLLIPRGVSGSLLRLKARTRAAVRSRTSASAVAV